MIFKCIIIDDEDLARTLIKNFAERIPNIEVVGSFKNPIEAFSYINNNSVDFVFLDIQMPEISGLDFLKTLSKSIEVIFTTAYSEYAVESYQFDATDYLLKPFSFVKFLNAVNRVQERLRKDVIKALPNETNQSILIKDYLMVKSDHKLLKVSYKSILYIEAMREYVKYHLKNERIVSLNTMKTLENELPSNLFIRIHKSYIISLDKLESIEGNMAIVNKERIPIGANYKDNLLKSL